MNTRLSSLSHLFHLSPLFVRVSLFLGGVALYAALTAPALAAQSTEKMAKEISLAVDNTVNANFSADTELSFSGKGEAEGIIFDVQYDSGNVEVVKHTNSVSVISTDESFSAQIDTTEKSKKVRAEDFLFPLNVSGNYAGGFLADIDQMKFAGKFQYTNLEVKDNFRLKNIVDGCKELVEPFENKWIEVDLGKLEEEFPEVLDELDEVREEILEEAYEEYAGEDLESLLVAGVEAGAITISKKYSTYTISSTDSLVDATDGVANMTITLSIQNGKITKLSFNGEVSVPTPTENISGEITFSALMSYSNETLDWPTFEEGDWELTKVVRMFLEFAQAEKDMEKIRNAFWYNLENDLVARPTSKADSVFIAQKAGENEQLKTALSILLSSDLREATVAYLTRYTDLEKNIKAPDIFFLARKNNIEISDWDADDVRYYFSSRSSGGYYSYSSRYKAVNIFELFIDDDYSYQPYRVNIDEEKIYQLDTKADFLILLARAIQASQQ
jgi:hypothetical protein